MGNHSASQGKASPLSTHATASSGAASSSPAASSSASDVNDLLDRIPADGLQEISDFIDSCQDRADGLADDDVVQSFLQQALNSAPSVMHVLGDIGQAAPLVGVVFAVLSAAGKRVSATSGTRKAYESLNNQVLSTGRVVQAVQHMQQEEENIQFPAPVQKTLKEYFKQLDAFAKLIFRFKGHGYLDRLWAQGRHQEELAKLSERIATAHEQLLLALGLVNGIRIESINGGVHEILKSLRTLPPLPIREDEYAKAILRRFGQMLDVADAMEGTHGSSFRELTLDAVFVEQDVRSCDAVDPSTLELPEELIELLCESGQLARGASQNLAAKRDYGLSHSAIPVLRLILKQTVPLVMILGNPGAGKSSALRETAIQWAMSNSAERANAAFPILIELKQYAVQRQLPGCSSLQQYVVNGGSVHYPFEEKQLLSRLRSAHHRVLLMLDGLDEVFPLSVRQAVLADIATFCNQFSGPSVRVIATSRIIGYRMELANHGFKHFVLQLFNGEKINQFLTKWYSTTYSVDETATRDRRKERLVLAINSNTSIAILAKNPLLLTMIAMVNRSPSLPTSRVELYEKCVELLLARWKMEEAVASASNTAGRDIGIFDKNAKIALLRDLAALMQKTAKSLGNLVQEQQLIHLFEEHVKRRFHRDEPAVAEALVNQLRERHGILCFLGGDSFAFVHRTFFEYFCALAISKSLVDGDLSDAELRSMYLQRGSDPTWKEVLCLTSGLIPSKRAGPPLQTIAQEHMLELVMECVEQLRDRDDAELAVRRIRELIEAEELGSVSMSLFVRLWPDDRTRALLETIARSDSYASSTALHALVDQWKDDRTRALLEPMAELDNASAGTAIDYLADHWTDESTHVLLETVARSAKQAAPGATFALYRNWKDECSRSLLEKLARSEKSEASDAVEKLASDWKDERSRTLLEKLARSNKAGASVAVVKLARNWQDDRTRALLESVADLDRRGAGEALEQLASNWKDDRTRALLEAIAQSEKIGARQAVFALPRSWRDERTRALLEAVAQSNDTTAARATFALCSHWHDDGTRALLETLAGSNKSDASKAVAMLANKKDERTRSVLESIASQNSPAAREALERLASDWKDDRTRALLETVAQSGMGWTCEPAMSTLSYRWKDQRTRVLLETLAGSDKQGAVRARTLLITRWRHNKSDDGKTQ